MVYVEATDTYSKQKVMRIVYSPEKTISLNQYYNSHFHVKTKLKQSIINNIHIVEESKIPNAYTVSVRFNNRLDTDNNVAVIKVILDYLRRNGYICDDNTKYFKSLSITFDKNITKNHLNIDILPIE